MCYKCGSDLEGAKGMCRACKRTYNKEHYRNNKQYYVDKAVRYKERVRQRIRDIKQNTPCTDCGLNYPYYVMDFDHKENKEFGINIAAAYRSWASIQKEMDKCDVVCSNCHRERTQQRALVA